MEPPSAGGSPKPTAAWSVAVGDAVLEALAEGVIVADERGTIRHANARAEGLFGFRAGELNGRAVETLWPTGDPIVLQHSPIGDPPPAMDLPRRLSGRRQDGSTFPLELRCSRVGSPDGPRTLFLITDVSEHDEAQSAMWTLTSRYQAQFKGFPLPSTVWQHRDGEFILIDFNDAAEALSDGEIRRLLGSRLREVLPPPSEIADAIVRCHGRRTTLSQEVSFRLRKDAAPKELFVTCTFIAPDIVLSHIEDITRRRHHEREVLKLSSAVEQTADSVMITDFQGVIEYVNPAFEATTGFSRLEALGRTPRLLKSGVHPPAFYDEVWSTLREGLTFRGTLINRKKDGEIYLCGQTITPMKDPSGRITHFVSVIKDLTETRKRQEQEFQMGVAREIQERLCRPADPGPGLDLAGATFPAVAVNGDFYDVVRFADASVGIVIADVCGHGLGAALVMTQTRALLRAFSETESDPAALLFRLNRTLAADLDDKHYVTLLLIRIDAARRRLDYANAGHPAAYLLHAGAAPPTRLDSTSIPLGILGELPSESRPPLPLEPGDALLLLTDGVLEASGADGEEFGAERALAVVDRLRGEPAAAIVDSLCTEARAFGHPHPQTDDITALVCKVSSFA
jgi:PAS domain S-box-containing protein